MTANDAAPRTAARNTRLFAWAKQHAMLRDNGSIPSDLLDLLAEREAEAAPPDGSHPRTYSLTASGPNGELFLVTDDESGINIGHANKIGGPLTAPRQPSPLDVPWNVALLGGPENGKLVQIGTRYLSTGDPDYWYEVAEAPFVMRWVKRVTLAAHAQEESK